MFRNVSKLRREFDKYDSEFLKRMDDLRKMQMKVSDESKEVIEKIIQRKWKEYDLKLMKLG